MSQESVNNQIDAAITNKTAEASCTQQDVGNSMKLVNNRIEEAITANVQTNLLPSATKSPSVNAVLAGLDSITESTQEQIDEAIEGLYYDAGNYDASVGTFPTTVFGGGGVTKGATFNVSVAGTLGGVSYSVGESFRAMVDNPGQTSGNWQKSLYVPTQATEVGLGTVRYATDTEVTNGTGNGVVTAEQLEEKLDNLPSGSQDLTQTLENGNTVTELNNKLTLTSGQIKLEDVSTGVAANLFRLALQFIKSSFTINLRPPTSLTANRTQYLPDEDGTLSIQKYKSYVALISQSGTSAPTVTVILNELGGTVVWSRVVAGQYRGTLTGAFVNNKTFIPNNKLSIFGEEGIHLNMDVSRIDANIIEVQSYFNNELQDDILQGISLEIRVYS